MRLAEGEERSNPMQRKILMVLLGLGAVAGFGAGFARLYHGGFGHHGPGGRFDRRAAFEQRVADTCTEAALRVYDRRSPQSPKP
jgi:hypothetical protein